MWPTGAMALVADLGANDKTPRGPRRPHVTGTVSHRPFADEDSNLEPAGNCEPPCHTHSAICAPSLDRHHAPGPDGGHVDPSREAALPGELLAARLVAAQIELLRDRVGHGVVRRFALAPEPLRELG